MASLCLQVFVAGLAAYCCSCSPASTCSLQFGGFKWPFPRSVVNIADVNRSLFNFTSTGAVSYKGRPFFIRFSNVNGTSPNIRTDTLRIAVPTRDFAALHSLFLGLPHSMDLTRVFLYSFNIPTSFPAVFIKDIVVYFNTLIFSEGGGVYWPYVYTYSITVDYGGYN